MRDAAVAALQGERVEWKGKALAPLVAPFGVRTSTEQPQAWIIPVGPLDTPAMIGDALAATFRQHFRCWQSAQLVPRVNLTAEWSGCGAEPEPGPSAEGVGSAEHVLYIPTIAWRQQTTAGVGIHGAARKGTGGVTRHRRRLRHRGGFPWPGWCLQRRNLSIYMRSRDHQTRDCSLWRCRASTAAAEVNRRGESSAPRQRAHGHRAWAG